jgi:hypothetical protein
VAVPWPTDISAPTSPFWEGVNALEQALRREVSARADLAGKVVDPTGAGGGVSIIQPTSDLRRAFTFLERVRGGGLIVAGLHATLVELGLVDPPPRLHMALTAGAGGGMEPSLPLQAAQLAATPVPVMIGLSSPSRPAALARPRPAAQPPNPWGKGPAGDGSELVGDPCEADLGAASTALVVALFRRLRGEADPGTTGTAGPGAEWVDPMGNSLKSIPYNVFARWASPLSTKLRAVREAVQRKFLANASTGGGGKDFDRAFRRMDTSGDGLLSVAEFKFALGPLLGTLDPLQLQQLLDFFDADGSGQVDLKEFLGNIPGQAAAV